MRKNAICKTMLLAVMLLWSMLVVAQTATDVSTLDYAVYASNVSAKAGEQVTLSVSLKNVNAITLLQTELMLPDGVEIALDDFEYPQVYLYEGTGKRTTSSRHSLAMNPANGMILCNSTTNKTFTGTDGVVFTITLNTTSDIQPGDYAVTFKNELMVETDGTGHRVPEVVSLLTIESDGLKGDVNNDGTVNVSDVTALVNVILGKGLDTWNRADVNEDGAINVSDVTALVNIILGK